ncbi:hypothetical protein [Ranid herpesvirus 3]|uniref:Uncharacterized protein n=1 Tax=Ranid herpesvirus 3 TaxID=1987509 RepID=A0A1X9T5B7_9VIRU|nr:hypothetical protein [Ranid herpesvirus 3]ARR28845.1 hypothetical protein [Ranid herpesvirus 3]
MSNFIYFPTREVNHLQTEQVTDYNRGILSFQDVYNLMEQEFGITMMGPLYSTSGQSYRIIKRKWGTVTKYDVFLKPPQSTLHLICQAMGQDGLSPLDVFSIMCTKHPFLTHEPGMMDVVTQTMWHSGLFVVTPCERPTGKIVCKAISRSILLTV